MAVKDQFLGPVALFGAEVMAYLVGWGHWGFPLVCHAALLVGPL